MWLNRAIASLDAQLRRSNRLANIYMQDAENGPRMIVTDEGIIRVRRDKLSIARTHKHQSEYIEHQLRKLRKLQ